MDLKLDSLDIKSQGIELVAVQAPLSDGSTIEQATVFVPDGKLGYFLSRFEQYANEVTKVGHPKNRDLVDRISNIRLASVRALWTDAPEAFPDTNQSIWWEVWLRRSDDEELARFEAFTAQAGIQLGKRQIVFDDRRVCLAFATPAQLAIGLVALSDLAELRRAKAGSAFFVDLPASDQVDWMDNLLGRVTYASNDAPAVCVLDTGVTRNHPLIEPSLAVEDATAVDPTWGSHDNGGGASAGHGTEMAGLALFGDLSPLLASSDQVELGHVLESVKILPPTGSNEPQLYGAITAQAVSIPEIIKPNRRRVFSLAVTAPDEKELGEPTSWSSAIDALAAGRTFDQVDGDIVYLGESEASAHRLFIVSAGNVMPEFFDTAHLDVSDTTPVQDPGQSWNALTVGAFTEKAIINDASLSAWSPIATAGDLSPWSSTSTMFEAAWPNKPEVVFEGGNVAHDGETFDGWLADLCLLTTYFRPQLKSFVITNATSAATAQGARVAAQIIAAYPQAWPETVRALIVHSARWTKPMQASVDGATTKHAVAQLVRRYGFGVPDALRAIRSARDVLTMVVEGTIKPYRESAMREMHVHELPWPTDVLESLGEQQVRLKVSLSYFVEPNPARLGWRTRHRYQSCGLRFDVKTPEESVTDFRKRLNKRALGDDESKPQGGSDSSQWLIGDRNRHRGSIHSDVWIGTAEQLAARGCIGVYPVSGWWKEQPKRDRSEKGVRYSLVVSIETDAENVDVWTPVATSIGVAIDVET